MNGISQRFIEMYTTLSLYFVTNWLTDWPTNQPTNSLPHSPSWEAFSHSASQEIPSCSIVLGGSLQCWLLSWATYIQSTPFQPISLRSILLLFSHLLLGLRRGPFSVRGFLAYYMPRPSCPWFWWSLQVMKLLIMQYPPASCYFFHLRSKYSLQHPVLRHPQYLFTLH